MFFSLSLATLAATVLLEGPPDPQSRDIANLLRLALENRELEVVDSGPGDIKVSIKTAEAMGLFYITVSYTLKNGKKAKAQYSFPKENPKSLEGIVEDIAASASLFSESGEFMGSAVILSDPPGARVYVNGKKQGTTPLTIRGFELAKPYNLTLVMAGYEGLSREINLTDITTDTLRFSLSSTRQPAQDTVKYSEMGCCLDPLFQGDLVRGNETTVGCLLIAGFLLLLMLF